LVALGVARWKKATIARRANLFSELIYDIHEMLEN